ncbi:protein of unknown function [Streptomyces murinus]
MRGVKNLLTGRTALTTSPIGARSHLGTSSPHGDDIPLTAALTATLGSGDSTGPGRLRRAHDTVVRHPHVRSSTC